MRLPLSILAVLAVVFVGPAGVSSRLEAIESAELRIRLSAIPVHPLRRPEGRDPVLCQHGRRRDERSNVL